MGFLEDFLSNVHIGFVITFFYYNSKRINGNSLCGIDAQYVLVRIVPILTICEEIEFKMIRYWHVLNHTIQFALILI